MFDLSRFFFISICLSLFSSLTSPTFAVAPTSFSQAKAALKERIYFDQNKNGALGTIYCGCDWQWVGRSAGRIVPKRCGYQIRAIPNRGIRTEIEHVVPASWLGQQRQCWQKGGRKNCNKTDPVFNRMEADLHNMSVSIGELNADRSNYRFGLLLNTPKQHGQCTSKVDFKKRVFEPRDKVKGLVARISFYMHDRYNLNMSEQQQRLFITWNKQYPVSPWELKRDSRIAKVMGHHNEFVTGQRSWNLKHRNSADGVVNAAIKKPAAQPQKMVNSSRTNSTKINAVILPIRGNRNSKIYHTQNCSSYNSMSPRNIVNFASEAEAMNNGYRKAKNCR